MCRGNGIPAEDLRDRLTPIIGMLYHPAHEKQMVIISDYYRKQGYNVKTAEADFTKKPEHEYRNDFYKYDTNYVLHIDSDEIILPSHLKKLIENLTDVCSIYRCNIIDYVDEQSVIDPLRPHKPIVATKSGIPFYMNRNAGVGFSGQVLDIDIHHLGYMTKVMDWKIRNYIKRNEVHELGNCALIRNSDYKNVDTPEEVLDIMAALA